MQMKSPYKVVKNKRKNVLCVVAQIVLLVALTSTLPSPSAFCLSSKGNAYVFAPGDKLLVTVFGHKDLSGEHTVDDQGYVQLPLGGPVRVGGATLQESQRRLKGELRGNDILQKLQVSVRIVELRPVFILGAVKKPGSFPFRFGMTVAQIVALAGGFGKHDQIDKSTFPEFIAANERVAILRQKHRDLRIRLARVNAQLLGAEILALPSVIKSDRDPRNQSMIKHERATLLRLEKQHRRAVNAIQEKRPHVEAEMAAHKEQRKSAQRQANLAKERFKIYESIKGKGLVKATTVLSIQNAIEQHQGAVARINARLSNLSQSLGELDVQTQKFENERALRLTAEKEKLLTEFREIEVSLPLAESLVMLKRSEVGIGVFADGEALTYKVFLSRKKGAKNNRAEVDLHQSISPGDMLDVRVIVPKQVRDALRAKRSEIQSMSDDLLH